MHLSPLIAIVFFSWFIFIFTATTLSISDADIAKSGSGSYFSSSLIYLPFFMAGYVGKRHGLFETYVQLTDRNTVVMVMLRSLALLWILGWAINAGIRMTVTTSLLHVSGEGCSNIETKIETLPIFPFPQRWPDVGCILCYQMYHWTTLVAVMILLPYHSVPFISKAGTRTLTCYLFLQACTYC